MPNKDARRQRLSSPGGKAGDRIRTDDVQLGKLQTHDTTPDPVCIYTHAPSKVNHKVNHCESDDPYLAALIAAWPRLPADLRRGLAALVEPYTRPDTADRGRNP